MTYDATILAEAGLVAYWPLNDSGATAADATGNGHALTLASGITTGAASLLSADAETAMTWGNTVAAESTIASPSSFALATFSAEFWVDFSSAPSGFLHLLGAAGATPNGGFGAGYRGGSGWLLTTYGHTDAIFTATANTGTVYYVVFTLDGSGNCKLYVNGSLQQTITGVGITTSSTAWTATIGGRSVDSIFLRGTIQKVALYNVALTATQVSNHYTAGLASVINGAVSMGGLAGGAAASSVATGSAMAGGLTGGMTAPAPGATITRWRGVASSGGEFGNVGVANVYNVDYHYDGLGSLQYYASRGHKLIRLPFSWERIQPTRNAALNADELGRIETYLANAYAAGLRVVLDMHNYCRYVTPQGQTLVLYTDFPESNLIDVWTRLSTALKGNPAVHGYEIMNEPNTLPSQTYPFAASQTVADFDAVGANIAGWSTNGGEAGSFALSTAQAHDGTHALAYATSVWAASGFDDVRLWDRQNTYAYDATHGTLSVWVYIPSTAGTNLHGHLELANSGGNDVAPTVSIPANTWTELTHTPAVGKWTGNQGVIVQLEAWSAAGGAPTFYVDGIQIGTKPADTTGNLRWQTTSQNILNAIRANGDNTPVWVDGYSFASATSWTTNHPTPWLTDAANAFRYVAHHYCGTNQNGNFETYAQENSDAVGRGYASLQDQAVKRLQGFTGWLAANNVPGAVTEIAWRGDESTTQWNAVGDAMYAELDAHNVDATYWAAGEWWPALASTMPAWYGVYTNGSGGGQAPVSVANPQAPVIEAHPSSGSGSSGALAVSDAAAGSVRVSDAA